MLLELLSGGALLKTGPTDRLIIGEKAAISLINEHAFQ